MKAKKIRHIFYIIFFGSLLVMFFTQRLTSIAHIEKKFNKADMLVVEGFFIDYKAGKAVKINKKITDKQQIEKISDLIFKNEYDKNIKYFFFSFGKLHTKVHARITAYSSGKENCSVFIISSAFVSFDFAKVYKAKKGITSSLYQLL